MRRLLLQIELDHHIPLDEDKLAAAYDLKTDKGIEGRIIKQLREADLSVPELVTLVGSSEFPAELRAHVAVEVYFEEWCEEHRSWDDPKLGCFRCKEESRGKSKA